MDDAERTPEITPCLWFDGTVEPALEFWGSLFPLRVVETRFFDDAGPGTPRTLMTAIFELAGTRYLALNGGPGYPPTPAFSFSVDCADQAEVDRYWDALVADGGAPGRCGWLTDRFGFSWQIVPSALPRLLSGIDRDRINRVTRAMLDMGKLDVAALEAAAAESS